MRRPARVLGIANHDFVAAPPQGHYASRRWRAVCVCRLRPRCFVVSPSPGIRFWSAVWAKNGWPPRGTPARSLAGRSINHG